MPNWFWIALTLIHFISLLWLFFVKRDLKHYVNGQIYVLGSENRKWVETSRLKLFRGAYLFFMIGLTVLSYLIFGLA